MFVGEPNAAGKSVHFTNSQTVTDALTTAFPRERYTLKAEFGSRFANFETQKFRFKLFTNLFAVDVDSAP